MFGCPGILPILVLAITSSLCWAKNEADPSSPVDLGGKWKRFCLDKTGNKFRQGRYFSLGCYKYTCVKGRRRTKIWKKTVLKAECCVSGASVFEHGEIVSNTTSKENCTREVDICRVENKIPLVQTSYYYGECCKFNGKRFEIGVEIPFENDCFRLKCKMGDHGPEIVSEGLEASTIQATVTDAITETTAATVTDAITGTTAAKVTDTITGTTVDTVTDAITGTTEATITDAIAETPNKITTSVSTTTENEPSYSTLSLTMEASTITESSSKCITIKGKECIFPFIDGGKSYESCKKYGKDYWCATSLTSSGKWKTWEYCDTTVCPLFGIPFNPTTTQPQTTKTDESPDIVSRQSWGARNPKETPSKIPDDLPMLFVHHSAGGECGDKDGCAKAVKRIQDFHMDDNNWSDIGYSFLIGGNGDIYEGRGWNVQGAHTKRFNSKGYGVCFIGNFMVKNPTQSAMDAFHSLVKYMVNSGKIKSAYKMYGHRQTKATDCPGDELYKTIQGWQGWTNGNI